MADEGSGRQIFGTTHQAFATGSQEPTFELLVLEDLLNWLQDPLSEEARQKLAYRDNEVLRVLCRPKLPPTI